MSEQIIDLRSTWAVLRRRVGTLVIAASVGALAGGAAVYYWPPVYSSRTIVLLPPPPQGGSSAISSHGIETQVQIAMSEAVLGPAGKAVSPPMGVDQVARDVVVESPTSDLLSITARGATPSRARALSEAVANAEIEYLDAASSSLSEAARNALGERESTLKGSLGAVTEEIKKTQNRLSGESATSAAGRADAAALAELTAQQADLALQIDQIAKAKTGDSTSATQAAQASVIQHASPPARMPLVLRLGIFEGVGSAAGFLLAAFVVVVRSRRERTLRSRDQIADAIGIPVAASIQSRAPRSVAGWTSLMEHYTPHNVEAWMLRQLLRLVTPGHPGSLADEAVEPRDSVAVIVLSLADDVRALALGPQFASFAASTAMATQLVTAQPHETGTALWAACSAAAPGTELRPGLSIAPPNHLRYSGDLVVHVAVVDRLKPALHVRVPTSSVTLLAVTAGSATAEELARVALAADDSGHPIARIVVVDPDPLDRTTGRLLQSERVQQVPLPSLMTGAPPGKATPLEQRRRFR